VEFNMPEDIKDTDPMLPPVIPAGQAQAALLASVANLASAEAHATRALETLIATSHAIARALDETVDPLPER
jgi:hypothetical protein